MIDSNIHRHRGYSLIDITKTDITKYTPELERMRNKQRNWETVMQVLGLRTQIMGAKQLKTETVDLTQYEFGQNYSGRHRVWSIEFEIEFADLYLQDGDPYGIIKHDLSQIPIILGLDETVNPPMPLLYTEGTSKNIYFIPIPNN